MALANFVEQWAAQNFRDSTTDNEWIQGLMDHLQTIANARIAHVDAWISSNLDRFTNERATMDELTRIFELERVDLVSNLELCKVKCHNCHLACILHYSHGGEHDCGTNHRCIKTCHWLAEHAETVKTCGYP